MKKILFILLVLAFVAPLSEGRQPQRGYRGFIEWSNSLRSENFAVLTSSGLGYERQSTFYTGFSTVHGYQINSKFFVGGGISLKHCSKIDNWIGPLFAMGRMDLELGKFTPFGDIRIGLNSMEGTGLYFSPSVGYRFNWGRKAGINVGAGFTLTSYKVENYEIQQGQSGYFELNYIGSEHRLRPYFSFRVGIDF